MKELYKKIIFSVLGIGLTGGLITHNVYLNNKIDRYQQELNNTIMSQTVNYSTSDKKEHLASNDANISNVEETEITEEYINELIKKYYEQQEKKNILAKNSSFNNSRPIENQITYVTQEIKQEENCKVDDKVISQVACAHEFEFTTSSMECPDIRIYNHICKKCGYKYSSTDNESIHTYGIILKDTRKTCTDTGTLTKKCNTCDKTIDMSVLDRGHKTTTNNSYGKYCSVCGEKQSGIWNIVWNATLSHDSNCSALADIYAYSKSLFIGINVDDDAWTTTANIKVTLRDGTFEEQTYSFVKDKGNYYNDFSKLIENERVRKIEITNITIKDKNGKILEENKSIITTVTWYDDNNNGNQNPGTSPSVPLEKEAYISTVDSIVVGEDFTVTVNIPEQAVGYQGEIEVVFSDNSVVKSGMIANFGYKDDEFYYPGNMEATFKALSEGTATIKVTGLIISDDKYNQINTVTELEKIINIGETSSTIPPIPSIPSTPDSPIL